MTRAALQALHPFAPAGNDVADLAVQAGVSREAGRVSLSYRIAGTAAVRLPDPSPVPARTDRLWEHTCLEAFLAPSDAPGYWEVNLSPSGDWQVYRFDGYREAMRIDDAVEPPLRFEIARDHDTFRIDAVIALPPQADAVLDVSLTAVIERHDGTRSYWALQHATAQPDFHDRTTFVLRVPREDV